MHGDSALQELGADSHSDWQVKQARPSETVALDLGRDCRQIKGPSEVVCSVSAEQAPSEGGEEDTGGGSEDGGARCPL